MSVQCSKGLLVSHNIITAGAVCQLWLFLIRSRPRGTEPRSSCSRLWLGWEMEHGGGVRGNRPGSVQAQGTCKIETEPSACVGCQMFSGQNIKLPSPAGASQEKASRCVFVMESNRLTLLDYQLSVYEFWVVSAGSRIIWELFYLFIFVCTGLLLVNLFTPFPHNTN